ncbi:MAG: sigma-70 family RNA polymerase sigma factor [Opitutaceae bacterium]
MIDDATLLGRYARDRSEEAFAAVVERHLPLVYNTALRRTACDAHRAKDVAQIVFTALARDATALSRHAALTGWLYAATRNAAIDLMRAERRRRAREEKAYTMEHISSPTENSADWEKLRPVLDEAMDELDSRDREAVLLRFFEGQAFAGVASALRVNEDAARKRVARALDKLRALLARRGIASTSGALAVLLANQTAVAAPAGVTASITAAALAGAGAAAGGAGWAGIFIMSTSKTVAGIAAVVAAVAIGSAIYQSKASRNSAEAAITLSRERDDLRGQLEKMSTRVKQSDDKLVATQKEIGDLRTVAPNAPEPSAPRPVSSQYGATMDYVLEHPETHTPFLRQQALRVKARYDRFTAASGLPADQQEQVLKTVGKLVEDEFDFMTALHAQGFGVGRMPQDPDGQAKFEQMRGEQRERAQATLASLRALLGDDRFRQFQQFASTIPERNVAEQMAARLYHTDTPFTAQQADQLTQILVQNRLTPQSTPSPTSTINGTLITPQAMSGRVGQAMQQGGMNLLDWPAPVSDAALARAQAVLTPAQLAALQQVQAQQVTQFQLAPPPPSATNPSATGK